MATDSELLYLEARVNNPRKFNKMYSVIRENEYIYFTKKHKHDHTETCLKDRYGNKIKDKGRCKFIIVLPHLRLNPLKIEDPKSFDQRSIIKLLAGILLKAYLDAIYCPEKIIHNNKRTDKIKWTRDESAHKWIFNNAYGVTTFIGICDVLKISCKKIRNKISLITLEECQRIHRSVIDSSKNEMLILKEFLKQFRKDQNG